MDVVHSIRSNWRRAGISEATLERWRSEGPGPKFLKLCGRMIYRQVDIEAYEELCLATSTKTVAAHTSAGCGMFRIVGGACQVPMMGAADGSCGLRPFGRERGQRE